MKTTQFYKFLTVFSLFLLNISTVVGQNVHTVIVEIKTGDKRFAGTDDPVHLLLGGKDFNLDNPNKDDFERNNTDMFTLPVNDPEYSIEIIRAVGRVTISKTEDSFFGGGWNFGGIKIWVNDPASTPIYVNESIHKWLDGDHREWHSELGEEGWNLPETPPFPPCTSDVIIVEDFTILLTKPERKNVIDDTDDPKIDSDCDGIPDDQDTTFDPNQPDQDGDGLPDLYEEQNGLNPASNDTDGDGWLDNNNIKDILLLTKVECIDEDGRLEIGSDEIYVNMEDVRFPLSATLGNYWEMDDNTKVEPFIIVDTRVTGNPSELPQYKTRVRLKEADIKIIESPTDDTFESLTLDWGRNETKEIEHNEDGKHYKLAFKSITITFMDPSPTSDGDTDGDDLKESLEFQVSSQASALRAANTIAISGYNGLASPLKKEMFIELDAVGEDNHIPDYAKQEVASQYYYQGIAVRIDDGYLHGGENLPFDRETVTIDHLEDEYKPNHFWSQRDNHFRYGLTTAHTEGAGSNGNASGRNIIVARIDQLGMIGDYSAIVFLHEWGHTLDLCHTKGGSDPVSSEVCDAGGNAPAGTAPSCDHYCGVPADSNTAMGDTIGDEIVTGGIIGALAGAIIGGLIAGLLIGTGIGGIILGVGIGLIGGGLVGSVAGFFFSDAYERVVDFHPNEWAALVFNVF